MLKAKPKLKVAYQKGTICSGCPLETKGVGFIHPYGTGSTPLLIIGEAAGWNEAVQGYPFQSNAEAGSVLERTFKQLGYQREQFVLWNLCACHPPDDKLSQAPYEAEAINHCRSYFDLVVQKYKPKVILALGSLPLKYLTGFSGRKKGVEIMRGYFLKGTRYPDIPVISSYHPSFLRRGNMKLFNLFCKDLSKAVAAAQGKLVEGRDFWLDPLEYANSLNFNTNPTVEEAEQFLAVIKTDPSLLIAYDIETDISAKENEDEIEDFGSQITQVQFSYKKGVGIALPYNESFLPIISAILSTSNDKAGHNVYKFDNPILLDNTIEVKGKITDTMWLAHHIQADLPIHLQAVSSWVNYPTAWKHLAGQDLATYGCFDVDAVQWIMEQLPKDLDRLHLRGGYERYVEEFYPILEEMTARGVPVNVNSLEELSKQVKARQGEIQKELDLVIPEGLRKVLPTKDGYKVLSNATKLLLVSLTEEWQQAQNPLVANCPVCLGRGYYSIPKRVFEQTIYTERVFNIDNVQSVEVETTKCVCRDVIIETDRRKQARLSTLAQWIELNTKDKDGVGIVQREFTATEAEIAKATNLGVAMYGIIKRWCRIEPFSPMSPQQVGRFIAHKGHTALAKKVMAKLYREGEITEEQKTPTDKAVLKKLARITGEKVYSLIVEFRELTKIQGTFIEGWTPNATIETLCDTCAGSCGCIDCAGQGIIIIGRVHPQFSFRPATWQLSSYSPNAQQWIKHSDLGKQFRKCIEAYPGHTLIELDMAGYHARMIGYLAQDWNYYRLTAIDVHSYLTAHIVKAEGVDTCLSLSDEDLRIYLLNIKTKHKFIRDKKAKPCIAEGELVLTNEGLVPIEEIKGRHLLWDGVEWVSHAGVICLGEKEIIEYDGLRATPDHIIYTTDGRKMPFSAARQEMVRLELSAVGRRAIRTRKDYKSSIRIEGEASLYRDSVCKMPNSKMDRVRQLNSQSHKRVWKLLKVSIKAPARIRQALRCYYSQMQQSFTQSLQSLWRQGYQVPIQISNGVYSMGRTQSTSFGLQRRRDRQERQQWALRTWESKISYSKGTNTQYREKCLCFFQGTVHIISRLRFSLRQFMDKQISEKGLYRRTDNRPSYTSSSSTVEASETTQRVVNKSRVYDILNAGSRHRFTVSNKLVSNCVLGMNLGLSEKGCYERNKDDFDPSMEEVMASFRKKPTEEEIDKRREMLGKKAVRQVYQAFHNAFPKIFQYQEQVAKQAYEQGYLQTPYGGRRWFHEVLKVQYDSKGGFWKTVNGQQREEALAFPVQANAHGHYREILLRLQEQGALEKYRLCNLIHDSLVFECPDELVDEGVKVVRAEMERESDVLVGFQCGTDVMVGRNMAELREYKGD